LSEPLVPAVVADLHPAMVDPHRKYMHIFPRRWAEYRAATDREARSVAWTGDAVAIEVAALATIAERAAVVAAAVFYRAGSAVGIEHRDTFAVDVDHTEAARRELRQWRDVGPVVAVHRAVTRGGGYQRPVA